MLKILKKMNLLLDRKQKRSMIWIILMMLVGGVLESLGVTMLVPIITVVLDPVKVEENKSLVLFNELSESRAILNMAHSALSKFKKVLILLMLSLIVLTTLFLINHM